MNARDFIFNQTTGRNRLDVLNKRPEFIFLIKTMFVIRARRLWRSTTPTTARSGGFTKESRLTFFVPKPIRADRTLNIYIYIYEYVYMSGKQEALVRHREMFGYLSRDFSPPFSRGAWRFFNISRLRQYTRVPGIFSRPRFNRHELVLLQHVQISPEIQNSTRVIVREANWLSYLLGRPFAHARVNVPNEFLRAWHDDVSTQNLDEPLRPLRTYSTFGR